jgi:chromosomal replication initiation ATPase DnaA
VNGRVEAIVSVVAGSTGVHARYLLSRYQTKSASFARHLAIYIARVRTGRSNAELASDFGRDTATIIHAIRRIQGELEDPTTDALVATILRRCEQVAA